MHLVIAEPITNVTVNRVLAEILAQKEDPEIIVYVNSQGGDVDGGYAIYEMLRLSNKKIITHALNEVFSCAITIYLAGDERYAQNYSNFMIHEPFHEFTQEISMASAEYRRHLKELKKTTEEYFKLICKVTKLTPQRIKKYVAAAEGGDWYFKPALAKKLGFVTKIGMPL